MAFRQAGGLSLSVRDIRDRKNVKGRQLTAVLLQTVMPVGHCTSHVYIKTPTVSFN
jgi:hypothetical protein